MRTHSLSIIVAIGLALAGTPVFAASLSGGASGGGAIQGGSGAPGSGVGLPGAVADGTTVAGIGEDATVDPAPSSRSFKALAPMSLNDAGQEQHQRVPQRRSRTARSAF